MRILVVIDSLGPGGAERLLVSLLPELKLKGIECDVAVLEPPYSLKEELASSGFKIFELGIKHRWMIPEALLKLCVLIAQDNYDAVWGHLYFGNLYGTLSGFFSGIETRVMTIQSYGYIAHPPARLWEHIRCQIEKFIGRYLASKIVAASESTSNEYVSSLGWSKVHVIPNAIPVDHLPCGIDRPERSKIRFAHYVGDTEFLLVTAARYVADKGHSVTIDALAAFRNQHGWCPRWIAVGHGPLKNELRQKAEMLKLSDSVFLLDALPQQELFKLIQAADAFVLPSLVEPFGIAAGEALALGVPCILSAVGGLAELAGKGESAVAKMVTPGDSAKLCDAIWDIYMDVESKERRACDGKQRIRDNFNTPIVAEKWCALFDSKANEATL